MLEIQILAKNENIWQKKIYKKFANPKNRRTFALVPWNTESKEADCDSYRFLGLYAVSPYAT